MIGLRRKLSGAVATVALAGASTAGLVVLQAAPASAAVTLFATPGGSAVGNCSNTAGNPKCTITRAHVVAAAGDTIQLDAGTYNEKLGITKAIIIQGPDPLTTFIGTAAVTAGTQVTGSLGALANVLLIKNVTIRGGVGGLFANTGTIATDNVTVTGNTGTTVGAGVIVNAAAAAAVILTNTTVTNNTANNGAGIFTLGGKITMTGGSVSNNTVNAIGGNAGTGFGGGIFSSSTVGGTGLVLNGVTVSGNKANSVGATGGNGGGIANSGTASITGGAISNNQANPVGAVAGNGGGVYNTGNASLQGSVTIQNTAITGNTATNGAGIANVNLLAAGAKITTNGGSINGNTATAIAGNANTGFGGGIFSLATTALPLSITNTQFDNNKALAAGAVIGTGGGIYTGNASSITGASITNNTATNGGGVFNAAASTVGNATITGNSATSHATVAASGQGGGWHNSGTGVITATGTTIGNNSAANGGGIYSLGRVSATGGSISDNTVTSGPANTGAGGGVYNLSAASPQSLLLDGVAVNGNDAIKGVAAGAPATQGGGIFHFTGTAVLRNGTTVNGNTAQGGFGGGIENLDGTMTMTGGSVSGNSVSATAGNNTSGWGGGILNANVLTANSTLNLTGVTVANNQALTTGGTAGSGGGLANTATAVIGTSPFTNNTAQGLGGGILTSRLFGTNNPTTTLTDSPITSAGPSSATFAGAGAYVGANAKLTSTNGDITNGAGLLGGGVSVAAGGEAVLDGSDVTGNTSPGGLGGGIYNEGTVSAEDQEISNNTVTSSGGSTGTGGGVYSTGTATLSRVTLAANDAQAGGSAVTSTGTLTLRNSTVNGNTSSTVAGAIATAGTATLSNDTIVGNTAAPGTGSTGGIARTAGTMTVTGSIVAQNGGNCFGTIVDGGFNLTDTTGPTAGACAFSTNAVVGDPQLNALGTNGGPTRTMLPKNNSPAINKIPSANAACPSIDQRGISRPQGASCDIGSVELEGIVAPTLNGPDHALFIVGTANSVGFTYTGVPKPTLSTTGDALPSGVTLTDNNDGTATLGGTAAAGTAGVYHFTIKAASGEPPEATINFTLTVIAPLVITTTSLPDGEVSVPYSSSVQATGGTTPYTWSISAGSLPAGLNLNTGTGAITGTPTGPDGPSNFTVKVVDSTGEVQQSATKALTISIKAATTLSANPAILRLNLITLKLSVINASATLTKAPGNQPVAGQPIRFVAGAQQICVAVTDANGFAKCPPTNVNGIVAVLLANGYNAFFDGTATLKPSAGHGGLVSG